jgi:hypothetical protein
MITKSRWIWLPAISAIFVAASATAKAPRRALHDPVSNRPGAIKMATMSVQTCDITSATLNLVDENILTWAAITVDTIDTIAKPVSMASGDTRLVELNALFDKLVLDPAKLPQIEMRMLLRLTCADGTKRVIAGSKTDSDGYIHLNIDGRMASTKMPLRKALEKITG